MSDDITPAVRESVRRQAEAWLAVKSAERVLAEARIALDSAQRERFRPTEALTVVVDGVAVTSQRKGPDPQDWSYVTSTVIG